METSEKCLSSFTVPDKSYRDAWEEVVVDDSKQKVVDLVAADDNVVVELMVEVVHAFREHVLDMEVMIGCWAVVVE